MIRRRRDMSGNGSPVPLIRYACADCMSNRGVRPIRRPDTRGAYANRIRKGLPAMTRTRGTIVRTLALSLPAGMSPCFPLALAWVGTIPHVICSEGVGWKVNADEPFHVDVWAPGMIQTTHPVSLAELLTASAQGQDVDLADFVRTFGDRLECNFHLWARKIRNGV